MPQWRVRDVMTRVRDVMTTEVITAPDDASFAELAAILASGRISAVPIVDRFDAVVGVVSWTDLRDKINVGGSGDDPTIRWRHRRASPLPQWPSDTARQVMSASPLTIEPDASLPAAARVMYRRNVGRLLVVDDTGRMRGIVTRSDLLKVHSRLDAVIRDEVTQRVLRRTLMIGPLAVRVAVDDGVVTLTGRTARRTTALAAARLTEAVAGVTDVVDRLAFDIDDTAATGATGAVAEPADVDASGGWLIGREPARSVGRRAGPDRRAGHHAQKAAKPAALQ